MINEEEEVSTMFVVSELLFYLIISILILLIAPSFIIYPGLYYGRWKTKGPVFELLTNDNTKIEGLILLAPDKNNCESTILFFHGNTGNIGSRSQFLQDLNTNLNANVLSIDYRGFGNSYGFPSESGLINDAESIFQRIINDEKFNKTKKIIYGHSLGGAVAIALAEKVEGIDGVIIENSFTSIKSVVSEKQPFNKIPGFILDIALYPNSWNSLERMGKLDSKINWLFISGRKDNIVNPKHMDKLFEQCKSKSKNIKIVEEGEHNNTYSICKDYYSILKTFVNKIDPKNQ